MEFGVAVQRSKLRFRTSGLGGRTPARSTVLADRVGLGVGCWAFLLRTGAHRRGRLCHAIPFFEPSCREAVNMPRHGKSGIVSPRDRVMPRLSGDSAGMSTACLAFQRYRDSAPESGVVRRARSPVKEP